MLEKYFIELIQKAILAQKPLLEINSKVMANEVFGIVNNMDNKVVEEYIRYYCYQVIDKYKNTLNVSPLGKVRNMSTDVYPLIAPNSPYKKAVYKIMDGCENANNFIIKINDVADKIRYELFERFIEQNRPLKYLPGELFQKSHLMDIIEEYIKISRDEFEEYVYHLIMVGLNERIQMDKKLVSSKEIHTIISYAIVGTENLCDLVKSDSIFNIVDEQYNKYCKALVSDYVEKNIALKNINRCVINDTKIMEIFFKMDDAIKKQYVIQRMDFYEKQRKLMCLEEFRRDCIDSTNLKQRECLSAFSEINQYISSLYDIYAKRLIEGNRKEISLDSDEWTLFFMEGPTANYRRFKFDDIISKKFRYEIKLYLMDECSYRIKNNVTLSLVKDSLNFLYNRDNECDSFAKIKEGNVRALDDYLQKEAVVKRAYKTTKQRSVNTLAKTMSKLKDITEFLIKYSKKNTLSTTVPKSNVFENISYRNRHCMSERTDVIPDIVLEQLDKYVVQLNQTHQLMYRIFENTGMRASSVCKLKKDCLKPSRYPGVMILKYKPYKLEKYNKKNGKLPREEIIISLDLANQIQAQIDKTEDFRKKYNSKYIFLENNENRGFLRPTIIDRGGFVTAVNRIIEKNNIVDYDGVIWHFTSRQFRKTLVSIMMDNNATDAEIAYVLGHNSQKTLNQYYKEINEQRIENLNHEFFKKRFGIDVGEENLNQYSDEEKECLYIDFVTNYRRVPLGYCSKPIADGPCDKESGASRCEKCSRICTGKQFVSEWVKLRDDRQRELNDLTEYYSKLNISIEEYSEYKEYQYILYEFNLYQDAIDKINGNCSEGV